MALKRSLSFPILIFYGVGTIIGAGIYVLIGKVASSAGIYAPLSFLLAGIIASLTALSYAQLVNLFPQSAGAAIYIEKAFNRTRLTQAVAIGIILTGITSAATMANGFTGYIQILSAIDDAILITGFVVTLTLVACWGIKQSAILITIITLLEISGLIYVLLLAIGQPAQIDLMSSFTPTHPESVLAIALGSFIAFYAFIGFEDMVNVVEEAKNPKRSLPTAILVAVGISLLFYISVAIIAVRVMPIDQLANSNAPLADLVKSIGHSPLIITFISLISIINGALVQMIMASRVIYGMANQHLFPYFLSAINSRTHTPIRATVLVMFLILILALFLPLVSLAKLTSTIMLIIFILVNCALIAVRLSANNPKPHQSSILLPVLGATTCFLLLMAQFFNVFF